MSISILPFANWASGTNQNSIPANDNALRLQIINGEVISQAVTAQPGSPVAGDIYIIAATHTGAQWATFTPKDLAIFSGGTWYAFAPVEGVVVNVAGTLYKYDAGVWTAVGTGGGTAWGDLTGVPATVDNIGDLVDPAADRLLFWDDSAGALVYLTLGTNLSITTTTINGTGAADRSTASALSTAAGVVNIDCALGDYFTLALSAAVTSITFSNLPGAGKGASLMVRITQDSTPRTVAWPASFRWEGAAPAVSTASGAVDLLALSTLDNGTKWDTTLSKARV